MEARRGAVYQDDGTRVTPRAFIAQVHLHADHIEEYRWSRGPACLEFGNRSVGREGGGYEYHNHEHQRGKDSGSDLCSNLHGVSPFEETG
jgi:hypothetical protein